VEQEASHSGRAPCRELDRGGATRAIARVRCLQLARLNGHELARAGYRERGQALVRACRLVATAFVESARLVAALMTIPPTCGLPLRTADARVLRGRRGSAAVRPEHQRRRPGLCCWQSLAKRLSRRREYRARWNCSRPALSCSLLVLDSERKRAGAPADARERSEAALSRGSSPPVGRHAFADPAVDFGR
jgi:hypothetical protein